MFTTAEDSLKKPVLPEQDITWIISEPLSGIAIGTMGILASKIGFTTSDSSEAVNRSALWYSIGSGLGIWAMGKLVEKEKGNLILTMLGSLGGAAIFNVLYNAHKSKGYLIIDDLVLLPVIPLVSGLVFLSYEFVKIKKEEQ